MNPGQEIPPVASAQGGPPARPAAKPVHATKPRRGARKHYPSTPWNLVRISCWFFAEAILAVPQLMVMRRRYRTLPRPADPAVAIIGDNLDEVNGIALSSRRFVRQLRRQKHRVYLVGVAFHTKNPRMESGGIFMVPARRSVDLPGYNDSELAVPRLSLLLRLLKRYPVDLLELETPGAMGVLGLFVARFVGIRTVSHFRTDVPAFADVLIKNRPARAFVHTVVRLFTRWSGGVIVPSEAMGRKLRGLGIPAAQVENLPRGVDLTFFHPDKRATGIWEKYIGPGMGPRLIYVGRVSHEKGLELLAEAFPVLARRIPDVALAVVGDGPYLPAMRARLRDQAHAHFPGVLRGQDLAGILAGGDCMVFPSATDTFGNAVLEALASGVPCVVSDMGGPPEIVEEGISGTIFRAGDVGELVDKTSALLSRPEKLPEYRKQARLRSQQFTFENSAKRFWEYYQSVLAAP